MPLRVGASIPLLESLLPRMLDPSVVFRCIPFEGKQDLEKQLMRKIRGYRNAQARFIVLRDQDSNPDCTGVKGKLLDLCQQAGRAEHCMVRIACHELETFYLADLDAVERALSIKGLKQHQEKAKFRTPDQLGSPNQELKALTDRRYEKIAGSRAIGKLLQINNQRSASFRNLVAAIRRMESDLLQT